MGQTSTAWWARGRGFLGQTLFPLPALVYLLEGRVRVIGWSSRPVFDEPVAQLELEITSTGNLRLIGPDGAKITLLPNGVPTDTFFGRRLLRRLPPEVAQSSPAQPDAAFYDPAPLLSADASVPIRSVAAVLQEHGAQLTKDRPYSRATVWALGALITLVVLAVAGIIGWIAMS